MAGYQKEILPSAHIASAPTSETDEYSFHPDGYHNEAVEVPS